MTSETNPIGLDGIEFVEYASPDTDYMETIFKEFGFSKTKKFKNKNITYYNQNDIHFLLNNERQGFSREFAKRHGPAICSMGWRVKNADQAFKLAVERGAKPATDATQKDFPYPAIYGIGDSLIYFIDQYGDRGSIYEEHFEALAEPEIVTEKGFMFIDHLTNNVYKGTMETWSNFYKTIFNFEEIRYFDIKGQKTALVSYALKSPCGKFSIPINEGKDSQNNQIDEYLNEYDGPGVQHLAFASRDLLGSLDAIDKSHIQTLDIVETYYDDVFQRIPWIKEDPKRIQAHQVLVDSQKEGTYLLQIFTKNLFGPIFIEMIQRENDFGFGEGNFQALFESIERDQIRRGVL